MIQEHYDNTVRQQKLLIRQKCDQQGVRDLDDVKWYRIWEELKVELRWDEMPETQKILIGQATGQARDEIRKEGLFPEGWDALTVYASS